MAEYDPNTRLTAGQLRKMGVKVPDGIPDCGWIPSTSIHFGEPKVEVQGDPSNPDKDFSLSIGFRISFREPFRWVTASFTIKEEKP